MRKDEQLGSYRDYKDLLSVEVSDLEATALYTKALSKVKDEVLSRGEDDSPPGIMYLDNRFFESHGHDLAEEAHA